MSNTINRILALRSLLEEDVLTAWEYEFVEHNAIVVEEFDPDMRVDVVLSKAVQDKVDQLYEHYKDELDEPAEGEDDE